MSRPTSPLVPVGTEFLESCEPTPNAVGRKALVSGDGCVARLVHDSAPRLLWYGEDLLGVRMPAGTRVVYPKPTIPGLPNRNSAVEYAIDHPEAMDPLSALLKGGMKVTIAIDDISKPLPKMFSPDVRESVLNIILPMLAEKGIDDVQIIIAASFHRKMAPFEVRHAVGKKIFNAYYPHRLYDHDAEAPDGMVELGVTELGEHVRINRRAAESDLIIYVNLSTVTMGGGHSSLAVGLGDYGSLKAHHTPATILKCDSYFDHTRTALGDSTTRMGRVLDQHLKVFHIETTMNNAMFHPKMSFFMKNEDDYSAFDHASFKTVQWALGRLSRPAKRKLLFGFPAAYEPIAVHAGATQPTHEKSLAYCYAQYCVPVEGQSDVVVFGIPFISPYNVNSILNPLLVQTLALGYFHNMYRNMPVVKKNGVMILTHPLYDEFDPLHHPSYIEFFHRILPETRDSFELQRNYEAEFAHNPEYIRMYRTGNAYHGVHPFYMWYWGENGRAHVGKTIVVGPENPQVARILGWDCAQNMEEALEMARSFVGRKPSITLMHIPPIGMADVLPASEGV